MKTFTTILICSFLVVLTGIGQTVLKNRQFPNNREVKNFAKAHVKAMDAFANETDSLALVALYWATGGPDWNNNDNWLTGYLGSWHGIGYNEGVVFGIYLADNNLIGDLPTEIGNLSNLFDLFLSGNQLTSLPTEIGNLANLLCLDLSNNQLTSLPPDIGNLSILWDFILGGNQLTSLPGEIGSLGELRTLILGGNQFTDFPYDIVFCNNLEILDLSGNQLTSLPPEIGNLSNLWMLNLANNQINDPFPMEICINLTSLNCLWFDHNNLGNGSCGAVQCLIGRGGWNVLVHSPQNDGFIFMDDCVGCEDAIAFAGNDTTICEGGIFTLAGATAENYETLVWTSSGDGVFDDTTLLNPAYAPGALDIENGGIELCLTAYAVDTCIDATDCMTLSIWLLPEFDIQPENITVQTGEDAIFTVEVSGTGPINLQWYGPEGIIDGATGTELTIEKVNFLSVGDFYCVAENVCGTVSGQVVSLEVVSGGVSQGISLTQGWSGISSYLWMDDPTVEDVFAPYLDELIIMMDNENVFWPGAGVNTIGSWDNHQGYKIKVAEPFDLVLSGSLESETTLQLPLGWTIIPVLSGCTVDIEEVFAPLSENIVIVKEVAGWNVYWPEFGINTIQILEPGRAYFVLMNLEGELVFPECVLKMKETKAEGRDLTGLRDLLGLTAPWKITPPSTISHIIAIPFEVIQNSGIGDKEIIGAFSADGMCQGLTIIEKDKNAVLTIFGNDPLTETKDGFDENDPIILKSYNPQTKAELILETGFDANYTGNIFTSHGLSVIRSIKTGFISEVGAGANSISIFPNPAKDEVNITGFDGEATITILGNRGSTIIENLNIIPGEAIDVSTLRQGVYFVEVSTNGGSIIEKLVKMK